MRLRLQKGIFAKLQKFIKPSSLRNYASSASLYVHWPYCRRRCTYCNFNKYISDSVDHDRMKACLTKEAVSLINQSGVQMITSIFFGGGTPSLAKPQTMEAVLEAVVSSAVLAKDAEISMEVNPTSVPAEMLKAFKTAGINRVSVGVQTLRGEGLEILGRDHTVKDSLRCLETARSLFPGKVSLDLMFGWPGQGLDMWKEELNQILAVCDKHLSLYQLTVEQGTPLFKQVQSGQLTVASPGLSEDMYLHAVQFLHQNGFERYEVANFAQEGHYGLHNMSYWDGGQYIGVGPGAHGRFQPAGNSHREARVQTLSPEAWMSEVETRGHGTRLVKPLSLHDRQEELLVVGLRTAWGITHETWSSLSPDRSLADLVDFHDLHSYISSSLMILDSSGLRVSEEGLNIVDTIVVSLLVALREGHGGQDKVT